MSAIAAVLGTIGWGLVTNFLSGLIDPPLMSHLTAGRRLENHDLQRALHLAFVRAQERIVDQCLEHPEINADDRKLLHQRRDDLLAERKGLGDVANLNPPVEGVAQYTLLLTPTTEEIRQQQLALSTHLFTAAAPDWLPAFCRGRLQEQLFDWTGRYFMMQVKEDEAVFRALTTETQSLSLHLQVVGNARLEAMLAQVLATLGQYGPRGSLNGNLPEPTGHFVGRQTELTALVRVLIAGRPGTVALLHGFGGMGKTELACEFARRQRGALQAGTWRLAAEGRKELLPLIGDLTLDLGLPPSMAPGETGEQRGRRVLAELKRRAEATGTPEQGGAALLVLDNVDQAALLLAEPQVNSLPAERWLKVVATARPGAGSLPARALEVIPVDRLTDDAAVALLRSYQPDGKWPADEDAVAARALAAELDGFALSLQTVAAYLGKYRELRPADLLDRLQDEGVTSTDALPDEDPEVAAQLPHREKRLGLVLDWTLERLSPLARTALAFAALLPPDAVVWPWLRALVEREEPGALERRPRRPDPWLDVVRQLTDLRLLTATEEERVARMHRLVGAHLCDRLEPAEKGQKSALVREQLLAVAKVVWETWRHNPEHPWELAPLQAAVLQWRWGARDTDFAFIADIVGYMEMTLGRLDRAELFLRGALEVAQAEYSADPQSDVAKHNLAAGLERLAGFLFVRGQPGDAEQALACYKRSLGLREAIAPTTEAVRDISACLNLLADLLVARGAPGDAERALEHYKRSLAIREELEQKDPASRQAMRDLSISLINMAGLLAKRRQPGDLDRALDHLERSLVLSQRLHAAHRDSAQTVRDLSVSMIKLADLLTQRGQASDLERALGYYTESLELREKLARANRHSAQDWRDLTICLERVADFLAERGQPGDLESALAHCLRSLQVSERLQAENPHSAQAARDVAVALDKLARLLLRSDNPEALNQAREYCERGLDISRRLLRANPESASASRDVLVGLERLAKVHSLHAGESAARPALELQTESLQLARQLWERNAPSVFYGRTLAVSLVRTARYAEQADDSALAARYRQECRTLLEQMLAAGCDLDQYLLNLHESLHGDPA